MNPVERLRYISQARGADPTLVAAEAAGALIDLASVAPEGLVTACRRLIERNVALGPLWWLSARMLRAADPAQEGADAAEQLDADPTASCLADLLDGVGAAVVVGWPDLIAGALRACGDIEVLVVDWDSQGAGFVRRLSDWGCVATLVSPSGAATAAVVADVVLVEALAAGPGGVVATPGSLGVAATAAHRRVPVWAVAGVGRTLPGAMWDSLVECLDNSGLEPWDRPAEVVPADLLSFVVGPRGVWGSPDGQTSTLASGVAAALGSSTCPVAPELLRIWERQ